MAASAARSSTTSATRSARPLAFARRASKTGLTKREREELRREHTSELYSYMREVGGDGIIVGIDEVGRGALAGPLTVGAVALPDTPQVIGIDDSKKLTPKRRESLAAQIREVALGIGVCHIPPDEIDACGMSTSLRVAMARALAACEEDIRARGNGEGADAVLIDGNPVHIHKGEKCIVKGDGHVACIAAASIVAKVTRDALMVGYADTYPAYHFESNKGYGAKAHIDALKEQGPCEIHRMSFLHNILGEEQLPLL